MQRMTTMGCLALLLACGEESPWAPDIDDWCQKSATCLVGLDSEIWGGTYDVCVDYHTKRLEDGICCAEELVAYERCTSDHCIETDGPVILGCSDESRAFYDCVWPLRGHSPGVEVECPKHRAGTM